MDYFLREELYFFEPKALTFVILYHLVDVFIFLWTAGVILRVVFPGVHHPLLIAALGSHWVKCSGALKVIDKTQEFEFVLGTFGKSLSFGTFDPHYKFNILSNKSIKIGNSTVID